MMCQWPNQQSQLLLINWPEGYLKLLLGTSALSSPKANIPYADANHLGWGELGPCV